MTTAATSLPVGSARAAPARGGRESAHLGAGRALPVLRTGGEINLMSSQKGGF